MRIHPPINFQPQNPLQSGNLRPTDFLNGSRSLNSNGALGGNGVSRDGVLGQALARAGALDAASAQSGFGAGPSTFDADTTAKNILDMVSLRLQGAVARGASKEELGKLLQQAREGAQTGFDAATTQLKDIGELDDSLTRGIGAALQKVDEGFSKLASQLGLDAATSSPAKTKSLNTPSTSLSELASGYNQQFASGQSAELTIRTADGDTVRLRIGANSAAGADGARRSSGGVTMEVEGDLDADETKALDELVGRVGKLADSFFSGDMDSALQQAEGFEFDNPELSSLSLTLRRSVSTYQDVQSLGNDALADYGATGAQGTGSTAASVKARLAEQLSALLPDAAFTENPADTLKQLLAAQVAANNHQDNPLLDFANRLLDAMGASTANAPLNTPQAA